MDKSGMRRPDPSDPKAHGTENHQPQHFKRNEEPPVPELQGHAKHTKQKPDPLNLTERSPIRHLKLCRCFLNLQGRTPLAKNSLGGLWKI